MAEDVFFFSKAPLDVTILAQCLEGLGSLNLSDKRLRVDCGDEGWLEFYFGAASVWDACEPSMKQLILSFIPQPVITVLTYKSQDLVKQAVSRLPAWGDVWIENDMDLLLTLQEVQQRIRLDAEWLMWDGDNASADLIVNSRNQGSDGVMVVLDDARRGDAAIREALVRKKLARCAEYSGSGEFARRHHCFSGGNSIIQVVYVVPPTLAMRAITSVSDPAHPEFVFPVEFVTEDEFRERHGFVPRDLPSLSDRY